MRYLLLCFSIIGLVGCGDLDATVSTDSGSGDGKGIAVPAQMTIAALPPGTTTCNLYIDDDKTPIATQFVVNGQATVNFVNVPVPSGSHKFTLEFTFESTTQSLITTAFAITDLVFVAVNATTPIDIIESDYQYPDDDKDNFSNLFELNAGTIPNIFTSPASLIGLQVEGGNLAQTFQANRLDYTASVAFLPDVTTVTALAIDPSVTLKIQDISVASGEASPAIHLAVGNNQLTILVSAVDGATQTYTINVTRANPKSGTFRFVLTGFGALGVPATTNLGSTTISFVYDVSMFSVGIPTSFSNGTGVTFTTTEIPISVVAGTTSYAVDPITAISLYDTTTNDQLNFMSGGNVAMQWNDFTSSTFSAALSTDFSIANTQLLDQLTSNVNFILANNGVTLHNTKAPGPADISISNASVTIEGNN